MTLAAMATSIGASHLQSITASFTPFVLISEIDLWTGVAVTITKTALLIEKVGDVDITASDRNLLLRCRLW
jgi:hypothetical protein